MKLKHICAMLPLALATMTASAETAPNTTADAQGAVFEFSTEVSRTVDRDLMQAAIYSHQKGKSLPELKKTIAARLNNVMEKAKQYPDIEIYADGITNQVNYNQTQKLENWIAEGHVYLKSKNFDAMAKVLENLGDEVAIREITFGVSPEKMTALEDEMTLAIIKQFQHKAEVIQKGLNSRHYTLTDVRIDTPNGEMNEFRLGAQPLVAMAKSAGSMEDSSLPLEAGKTTLSARASGKVKFE